MRVGVCDSVRVDVDVCITHVRVPHSLSFCVVLDCLEQLERGEGRDTTRLWHQVTEGVA